MDLGTRPTANEVKVMLEPHPTCGFVAETYRSPLKIPAGALPEAYEGDRPYGPLLPRRPRRPDRHAQDTLRPALPPLYGRSARGIDALS